MRKIHSCEHDVFDNRPQYQNKVEGVSDNLYGNIKEADHGYINYCGYAE